MDNATIRQESDHKLQIRKSPTGCWTFLLPRISLDIPIKKKYNAPV